VSSGVYGLIGVIVGGFLTWIVQYRAEWRKRVTDARGSVRLLNYELSDVLRHVRIAADAGHWWSGAPLTLTSWEEDKRFFASTLRERSWWGVQAAVAYVHQLNALRELRSDGPRSVMDERDQEEVRTLLAKLEKEQDAFQEIVVGIEPPRLRLMRHLRRLVTRGRHSTSSPADH
jgi:hypothetical protein